jgi:Zn-dependent protease with chaperone function
MGLPLMKFFFVLLILHSCFLFAVDATQKKVDPQIEQTVRELLKQEGIDPDLEIYAKETRSFAGLSYALDRTGPKLSLVINQAKFNTLSLPEQRKVILHEIGHIKRGAYRGILCAFGPYITALTIAGIVILKRSFSISNHPEITIGMALVAGYVAKLITHLAFAAWARHEEFAADTYAFNADHNVEVMRSLLEKRKKLFETKNMSWWSRLFEYHPSSEERIAHIQKLAQKVNLRNK